VTTRYDYDALNRLVQVTENFVEEGPQNAFTNVETSYSYDAVGNLTNVTNPLNQTTSYGYDALNRLTQVTDPLNNLTQFDYDAVGNRTGLTDANAQTTDYSYDALNRLTTISRPDETVSYSYDAVGNRLTVTDPTGQTTYSYDPIYRLTGVTDPFSQTVGYSYDPKGNVIGLVYPDSEVVTYDYDALDRLTGVVDWDSNQTAYSYDDAGQLLQQVLPNGITSTYQYDDAGQLTLLQHAGLTQTVASYGYSYDLVGNRIQAVESVLLPGFSLDFSGAPRSGPAESPHSGAQASVESTLIAQITPKGGHRDAGGRASTLTHPYTPAQAAQLALIYNPMMLFVVPLAIASPFVARRRRRRAWLVLGLVFLLIALTPAAIGQGSWEVEVQESPVALAPLPPRTQAGLWLNTAAPVTTTITYTYDPLYRLTQAGYTEGDTYGYSYDAASNRATASLNGVQVYTYTYDAANRLTQVNDQPYSYDDNGNLLADGVYTYTYDTANRLTQLQDGVSTVDYIYNGDGVRVAEIVDGLRTDFVQDVASPLPQVLTARQGGSTARYLRGLGLIGEHSSGSGQGAGPATWQYVLPDALGSVRQLTDPTGQVALSQQYDPFGGLLQRATLSEQRSAYGFAGEEQDPDSGLVYLRARSYNPASGRFLQQDPLLGRPNQPGTLHRYAYAFNNPVNYVDPAGLMGERDTANGGQFPFNYAPSGTALFPDNFVGGTPGFGGGFSPGSVNGPAGQIWQPFSNPHARGQSRGFDPFTCGLWGLRDTAAGFLNNIAGLVQNPKPALDRLLAQATTNWNRNIRELRGADWRALADPDAWKRHGPALWQAVRAEVSLALDLVPIVGDVKGIIEGVVGQDLAGHKFSEAERTLVLVGSLVGMFTIADELMDAGKLLRHAVKVDAADAVKAGRGLGRLAESRQALKRGLNRTLQSLDDLRAGRRISRRLNSLDNFTNAPTRHGDDLRQAFSRNVNSGSLSRRINGSPSSDLSYSSGFGAACGIGHNSFTAGTPSKPTKVRNRLKQSK
jgi:RHS repeat-associated protein